MIWTNYCKLTPTSGNAVILKCISRNGLSAHYAANDILVVLVANNADIREIEVFTTTDKSLHNSKVELLEYGEETT